MQTNDDIINNDNINKRFGSPIAPTLGINYPFPLHLHYAYPPINDDILCNILIALKEVPRLYEQVLHLMNKMNLPPPFRQPPSSSPINFPYLLKRSKQKLKAKKDEKLSSDESEISSSPSPPRSNLRSPLSSSSIDLSIKKFKLEKEFNNINNDLNNDLINDNKKELGKRKRDDIKKNKKQINIILNKPSDKNNNLGKEVEINNEDEDNYSKRIKLTDIKIDNNNNNDNNNDNDNIDDKKDEKMNINIDNNNNEDNNNNIGVNENLEIKSNEEKLKFDENIFDFEHRLSIDEIKALAQFQKYSQGNPTAKLYIKNLGKSVLSSHLLSLFSPLLLPGEELVVDLKTKGRLRGQAWVTFPSVDQSIKAMSQFNGVLLFQKPIVIVLFSSFIE